MASVPRSPARTRSKGNHVSPGSGSVGEADDKLSEAGILITEDFDPDANITDKGKQSRMSRKRRKVQETAADSVLDDSEFKDTQEKRKAARPSRQGKYIAGRRGHLKLMTEIPIDTLHEIFRQLDPADLLTLSWSSKSLRLVITEKSARYIWQEAFERLYESSNPPPPCPEDLNFAQYARFLFVKKCMVCDVANGHWTSWMMRLRACSKCLESEQDFLSISTKKTTYCLSSDVVNHDIEDFFKEDNEEFTRRRQLKEKRLMGERSFRLWEKGCAKNREAELDVIRLERRKAILKKLEDHGWKESEIREVYHGKIPNDLPGLGRAKKLTNKVRVDRIKDWQDLEPKLLQHLAFLKTDYLCRQKHKRLENRWHAFEEKFKEWTKNQTMANSIMPRVADIAILEPFRSTIFGSDTETATFEVDAIDPIANGWVTERNNFILSLLPQSLKDRFEASDFSSLQSLVILRFRALTRYITLDEVLEHRDALWRCEPGDADDIEIRDMLSENAWEFQEVDAPWFWSNENLSFDNKAFEIVKDILEFLGQDPYSTTLYSLELFEGSFKCISCPPPWLFMRQRCNPVDMIEHDVSYHDEEWTPAHARWREEESDFDSDSDSAYVSVAELMGLML
ncbi:hypothetical protein AGABI1DRAFT_105514 [Agaricus bisporus var. burnettii JB137-S8]|uniref:F-box domain-containing protein n=1 Tax=Agaricus bisporus var. burnettii (strain JB137-S8 / ATCC MYA-4627 / FGSC 10392) TaxID=597362 RepID=K5Y2T4_AGABU|nr:uncharacterized protein AGABI1DRAFT_105514 [Agaricus bisporus var. burnettii JB137-S8]EKM82200.1 hypothetical protein AGABI1DRAFT_105514 [Agaricus bisporus var. burnettii JB137-S8]